MGGARGRAAGGGEAGPSISTRPPNLTPPPPPPPPSYNFCSEDGCDGGFKKGACHLKRFSGNAPAWGCSGDAQKWRSGLMSPSLRYDATPPPCAAPGAPPSVADGVPTSARANWAGTLVVLDVDSGKMGEGGNHGSPYVRTPYACAYNCHNRVGKAGANGVTANAFTYCDDPEGCGSGCAQFSRGNAPKDGSKDELYFGPFLDAKKSGCTDSGDRFKYQTCSCKAVGGEPVPVRGRKERDGGGGGASTLERETNSTPPPIPLFSFPPAGGRLHAVDLGVHGGPRLVIKHTHTHTY